jgi:hypothetical protein
LSKATSQAHNARVAHRRGLVALSVLSTLAFAAGTVGAQLPFTSQKTSGQTVTPAFEGWYRNPDGTFTLSFGYYNRNATEVVEIPVGAANFVSPGDRNQGQPIEFQPDRQWGVFGVRVPADFGDREITWTLSVRGTTYAIPGFLRSNWQIDALEGEAGSGNTPPGLRFSADGPEARGPLGITARAITAVVGTPISLTVWAKDDGKGATSISGRGATPAVTLAWFRHQGPAGVSFQPATARIASAGAQATSMATFSEAGEYLIRVRASDSSLTSAGHAQCCWTNGFFKVNVTR